MESGKRWVWDLYPLSARPWGNQLVKDDGTAPGHTTEVRRVRGRGRITYLGTGETKPLHTVTFRRSFYVPTDGDIALIRRLYPNDDPYRPAWDRIEAELVVAGHGIDELRKQKAPTVLRLLEKLRLPARHPAKRATKRAGRGGQAVPTSGSALTLKALARRYPKVTQDGRWVSNRQAAGIESVNVETLRSYRAKGEKLAGGRFGRDQHGRIWRIPEGVGRRHPCYLKESLRRGGHEKSKGRH